MLYLKKKIIFILPYLNVNTTSSERFKSFIKAAEKNTYLTTEVITIDYGIKRSYFAGLSNSDVDYYHPKNHQVIKARLNPIQKLGFACINQKQPALWRVFQLFHLLFYRKDIFYPQNIDLLLQKDNNPSGGYVFSSGSHFSLFTTAQELAQRLNYKLILDYRDPWTFGYNPIDGLKLVNFIKTLLGRSKEKALLNQADLITTVSESLRSFFPPRYHKKIEILPNGSNFLHSEVSNDERKSNIFNIVYAGTVYDDQLKDETFFQGMGKFIIEKDLSKINIKFLGSEGNTKLCGLIGKYGLSPVTSITPRISKASLLHQLNKASVFLHLKYTDNKYVISSKQAEYLNFSKPILLPVSDKGDIAKSILNNNAGYVCNNTEELVEQLNKLWEEFENGNSLKLTHSKKLLREISRESIATKLMTYILNLP